MCLKVGHNDHQYCGSYEQKTTNSNDQMQPDQLWQSSFIIPNFVISVVPYTPKERSHSIYSCIILIPTQDKHSIGRTILLTHDKNHDN
jgi:hypothetical protein